MGSIMRRFTVSFLVLAAIACAPRTYAQTDGTKDTGTQSAENLSQLNLEDLLNMQVTTASKKAEKASDAPGIMQTITAEEIHAFGANNLTDILQMATSVQPMSVSVFPDNYSLMRGDLRSNQDTHILLLLNGRPVREGTNGGTDESFYTAFPIQTIDRIEIVRGPGSVLYGSNAFVGVINVITKQEQQSTVNVTATAGSFNTLNGSVAGSVVDGDLNAHVGLRLDNIKGWNADLQTKKPASPEETADFNYGQKNVGLVGDLNYKGLRLLGFYANTVQDMLGIVPYASYVGKNKFQKVFMNLGYNYKFSDAWEASVNATQNSDILHIDADASGVAADHQQSLDYLGEATVNGSISERVNVVFGGVVESRNKNEAEPTSVVPVYHQTNLSAYAQSDYRPIDMLKLILGGQLNRPDGGSWSLVPRVGAVCSITDRIGAKVLYGQAFRSPYPLEQYINNGALIGNPAIEPERIGTLDAQLSYSGKSSEVSVAYFNSRYFDSIAKVPTASNPAVSTYVNQGDLVVSGFELEGKSSVLSNMLVTGSATYQKNKEDVMITPNFMAKLGVMYNTGFGLSIGLFNSYFGAPKANSAPAVNPAATAVSLFSTNLTYKLPVSVPVEIRMYAQNIFNVKYNFTEFNRNWVNTFPVSSGIALYGGLSVGI